MQYITAMELSILLLDAIEDTSYFVTRLSLEYDIKYSQKRRSNAIFWEFIDWLFISEANTTRTWSYDKWKCFYRVYVHVGIGCIKSYLNITWTGPEKRTSGWPRLIRRPTILLPEPVRIFARDVGTVHTLIKR